MTTTRWTPEPKALPRDPAHGSRRCGACPEHPLGVSDHHLDDAQGRYELGLEGVGLDGHHDHRDALRILRRAPGFCSGPFEVPVLPAGMPAIAVLDYLERQTFDARESADIVSKLVERYPDATVHVWAVAGDVSQRIAEDAYCCLLYTSPSPRDHG